MTMDHSLGRLPPELRNLSPHTRQPPIPTPRNSNKHHPLPHANMRQLRQETRLIDYATTHLNTNPREPALHWLRTTGLEACSHLWSISFIFRSEKWSKQLSQAEAGEMQVPAKAMTRQNLERLAVDSHCDCHDILMVLQGMGVQMRVAVWAEEPRADHLAYMVMMPFVAQQSGA